MEQLLIMSIEKLFEGKFVSSTDPFQQKTIFVFIVHLDSPLKLSFPGGRLGQFPEKIDVKVRGRNRCVFKKNTLIVRKKVCVLFLKSIHPFKKDRSVLPG